MIREKFFRLAQQKVDCGLTMVLFEWGKGLRLEMLVRKFILLVVFDNIITFVLQSLAH